MICNDWWKYPCSLVKMDGEPETTLTRMSVGLSKITKLSLSAEVYVNFIKRNNTVAMI
jgi:hypothetical protein